MAIAAFSNCGGLWLPARPPWNSNAPGYSSGMIYSAANDRWGLVIKVPKTGTLQWFETRMNSVTQCTNGLRFSFQDLSSGNPDNTEDQYRVVTGVTTGTWLVPSGPMTNDGTDGGTKRSVTEGDDLALCIRLENRVAGDFLFGSKSNFTAGGGIFRRTPYHCASSNAGSSWTKDDDNWNVALRYDDGTYAHIGGDVLPWDTLPTNLSYQSSSTPDEIGNKIILPFAARAIGAWYHLSSNGACDLVIYDAGGSAVKTQALPVTNTAAGQGPGYIKFSSALDMTAQTYRMVLKPGAANVQPYEFTVNTANAMAAFEGGASIIKTERTDAGAWTDTSTKRLLMGLHFSGFDDGTGSGGSGGGSFFAAG